MPSRSPKVVALVAFAAAALAVAAVFTAALARRPADTRAGAAPAPAVAAQQPARGGKAPDFTLTAEELWGHYVDNRDWFAARYKGKVLRVSGTVAEAWPRGFRFKPGEFGAPLVECQFTDAAGAKLSAGQQVTVQGELHTVRKDDLGVVLGPCRVVD